MKNLLQSTALAVCLGIPAQVLACDLEAWTWRYTSIQRIEIEGSTTCKSGWIYIRLYDGKPSGDTFIGIVNTFIEGYTFTRSSSEVARPKSNTLHIRYSIESD